MTHKEFERRKREILDLHRAVEPLFDVHPVTVIKELREFAAEARRLVRSLSPAARNELEHQLPDQWQVIERRAKEGLTEANDPLLGLARLARSAIGDLSRDPRARKKKDDTARGEPTKETRDMTIQQLAALYRERAADERKTALAKLRERRRDGRLDPYDFRSKKAELLDATQYRTEVLEFLRDNLEPEGILPPGKPEDATLWRLARTRRPWK